VRGRERVDASFLGALQGGGGGRRDPRAAAPPAARPHGAQPVRVVRRDGEQSQEHLAGLVHVPVPV